MMNRVWSGARLTILGAVGKIENVRLLGKRRVVLGQAHRAVLAHEDTPRSSESSPSVVLPLLDGGGVSPSVDHQSATAAQSGQAHKRLVLA